MQAYDLEYYFIEKTENNDKLPSLVPDVNTVDRRFRYEKQPMGSPPLVFYNGWKNENLAKGIKDFAADILFSGADLVVKGAIREVLLEKDIPDAHMHPAIYIDDRDVWHEDYWYLTFTGSFDCWDRAKSRYKSVPIEMGGITLYSIYDYSLNQQIIETTPFQQRLLFKMGASIDGTIVCHKSLSSIFRRSGNSGAMLTLISDY